MILDILRHTPVWVFAVLALLIYLGTRQLQAGRRPAARVLLVPVAMVGLALLGVLTVFTDRGVIVPAVLIWALMAGGVMQIVARRPLPARVGYDAASRSFDLPGDAVPLVMMMAIFLTKYAVAVTLALHPEMAHQIGFALAVCALYGVYSGLFAGRALRLFALSRGRDAYGAHRTPSA